MSEMSFSFVEKNITYIISQLLSYFHLKMWKKGKNGANFLGTSPKIRFQTLNSIWKTKVIMSYTVFYQLSDDENYFFN